MARVSIAFVLGFALIASSAFAADADDVTPRALNINAAMVATAAPAAAEETRANFGSHLEGRARRPGGLRMLYATSIALQGVDAYTTMSALKRGGVEANPMVSDVVKNPMVFVAMKAGVAAVMIVAAENMWKHGHRMAAIGVMVTSNIAMGLVATNNARVLSSLK